MTWQNRFVTKLPKIVWRQTTFLIFLYMSHVTKVCHMPMTCDCWSCLLKIIVIVIISNLLIPTTKNTKCNPRPPLLPCSLVRRSHKKISHHCHDGNRCSQSCACNFSHSSPFWLLRLHQWVLSPKQQCWLVWLLPGVGRRLFSQWC